MAPARRHAEHRRAETHQRVEEASHICRERALYARLNASRTLGGVETGTRVNGSILELLGPAGAASEDPGLCGRRRCIPKVPPRANESYELCKFVTDVLRQFC